tara:strand:- start:974 stop:1606 length:633 start_codon:yes stop_codon:yes gene_type:complete
MKRNIYNLLFEVESSINSPETSMTLTSTSMKARKALDSVDDQIDALILRYEASSIREEEEERAIASLNERSLEYLVEQEEELEEPAAETGEEDVDEPEEKEPTGSEQMDVDKPAAEQAIPNLDMDAFAARTVRLIKNYKSLLRMEEAIGNRIKHFLDENYGDKYVQRYLEILENQYGLSFEEFEDSRGIEDEKFAVGAYAGGTGGLGGGG